MKEWSDIDKGEWILRNGEVNITWVYERSGDVVYRRPASYCNIPPWISEEREVITH